MKYALVCLILVVTSAVLFALSGQSPGKPGYHIEKASPNGTYRVEIQLREEGGAGGGGSTERLKVQYFKGREQIYTYEADNSDQYEPSMRRGLQVVEWVADNVLRMGEDKSAQPFDDELIFSNDTDEYLKYLEVSYGRFEALRVFDLAPKSSVVLRASPGFKPDGSSRYFLGYGGVTQGGKSFGGAAEAKQRKSPADGPLRFQITINAEDLR